MVLAWVLLQALERDPAFVNARVGMADALLRSPQFEHVPGTILVEQINTFVRRSFPELDDGQRYAQAREALETALDLDQGSAEAWAALGRLETWLGDREQAEAAFSQAIDLQPNYAAAHYEYAKLLAGEYRYREATLHFESALRLDPVSVPDLYQDRNGWIHDYETLMYTDPEKAGQFMSRMFADVDDPGIWMFRVLAAMWSSDYDQALEYFDRLQGPGAEKALEYHEFLVSNLVSWGHYYPFVLKRVGRDEEADRYLAFFEKRISDFRGQGWDVSSLDILDAWIEVMRGDHDAAIDALERADDKRQSFINIETDPILSKLRDDPRFQALVDRFKARQAGQLALLRERHKVPPPWSPDYPQNKLGSD